MKMEEIKKLTTEEITSKIKESKDELFNLRFSAATGMVEKPHRIRELRHTVARLKTELSIRDKKVVGEK